MTLNKVLLPVLLFASFLFAQNLYIETLDEQKSSNNLLVFRFRVINNTPVTIRDASLRYCLTKSPNKIVRAGECDTLKGIVSYNTIKVEAGGKLYFDEGEITVDNLQLDARATIDFVKPGFSTILHVNEKIQWNASAEYENKSTIAKGFKLYYYGGDRFFVHGAWAGTIIAPNAQLILGQTHNKELYGQFYGKSVIVHQYSKVSRVPFKPQKSTTPSTLLDVAWIGGRK